MTRVLAACQVAVLLAVTLAAGCEAPPLPGQSELELISVRTMKDEVLRALPNGPREPGEGVARGYRLERYFVGGGWAEVLWVEPAGGWRRMPTRALR